MRKANLSVWSAMFDELPIREAIEILMRHGFQAVEISYEHAAQLLDLPAWRTAAAELRDELAQRGFRIPQGHLDFVTCDPSAPDPAARRGHLDSLKTQIELFGLLGVRRMVIHAGGAAAIQAGLPADQVRAITVAGLRELCDAAAAVDADICVENMRRDPKGEFPQRSSADLLALIDAVAAPNLSICYDTGHLALSRAEAPRDFIRNCGAKLRALHVADNMGEYDDHLFAYNGTAVDWPEVAAGLQEIGYEGLINFEISGERRPTPLEYRELKLDYAMALGCKLFSLED